MNHLSDILQKFKRTHLLVVGDLMLDRFIWGDGKRILEDLRRLRVSMGGVFSDGEFQTIQKTRIIARPRHQQIVRLDREKNGAIREPTLKKLRQFVLQRAGRCDGVVISDYGKGVVHERLLAAVTELVERRKLIYVVDPKKENYARYRSPSLITPNKTEAADAAGIDILDDATLVAAGERLLRMWKARAVLITRGPDGMSLFRPRASVEHFSIEAKEIFDVTGAGDTVVAVCALVLATGASYKDAAVLANLAAGLVGDEVGTVAVPLEKLERAIKDRP